MGLSDSLLIYAIRLFLCLAFLCCFSLFFGLSLLFFISLLSALLFSSVFCLHIFLLLRLRVFVCFRVYYSISYFVLFGLIVIMSVLSFAVIYLRNNVLHFLFVPWIEFLGVPYNSNLPCYYALFKCIYLYLHSLSFALFLLFTTICWHRGFCAAKAYRAGPFAC